MYLLTFWIEVRRNLCRKAPPMIRVLIVDDDASIRELLAHKFTSELNMSVTEASSGNEAIALIEGGARFCLIVSDYNMGDGNGDDLLKYMTKKNLKSFFILFTSEADLQIQTSNRFFLGVVSKTNIRALMRESVLALCMAPAYFKNLYPKQNQARL